MNLDLMLTDLLHTTLHSITKRKDFSVNQIAGYHVLAANGYRQCKRVEPFEKVFKN